MGRKVYTVHLESRSHKSVAFRFVAKFTAFVVTSPLELFFVYGRAVSQTTRL